MSCRALRCAIVEMQRRGRNETVKSLDSHRTCVTQNVTGGDPFVADIQSTHDRMSRTGHAAGIKCVRDPYTVAKPNVARMSPPTKLTDQRPAYNNRK
jgi:hypothetical protein